MLFQEIPEVKYITVTTVSLEGLELNIVISHCFTSSRTELGMLGL